MIARLALVLLVASPLVAAERKSGYDYMSADIQAMQDDEMANPGMLWVAEGGEAWEAPAGGAGKACADCHGAAEDSMAGVAAAYPAFDEESGEPVDLAGRINLCRVRHQQAEPLDRGSHALLALTAFVARQSDGRPIAPDEDPRLDAARAQGRALFTTRMGQLNFSCADCHDDHSGGHLAAATIPQAHPTGYPQYRLEWQDMGGLHRRFDNCMFGIRAEPFAAGSPDYIALELYLMQRAAGMKIEAPAVRP